MIIQLSTILHIFQFLLKTVCAVFVSKGNSYYLHCNMFPLYRMRNKRIQCLGIKSNIKEKDMFLNIPSEEKCIIILSHSIHLPIQNLLNFNYLMLLHNLVVVYISSFYDLPLVLISLPICELLIAIILCDIYFNNFVHMLCVTYDSKFDLRNVDNI